MNPTPETETEISQNPQIFGTYCMWKLGKDLKSILSKTTYYEHKKALLKFGVDISEDRPDIDIAHFSSPQEYFAARDNLNEIQQMRRNGTIYRNVGPFGREKFRMTEAELAQRDLEDLNNADPTDITPDQESTDEKTEN